MFLVVGRLSADPSTRAAAAAATGLALPDFVRRITGPLPRIVASGADRAVQERAAQALNALGYGAVTVDPAAVPDDARRLVARALSFEAEGLAVTDSQGVVRLVPWRAVVLVQRGLRTRVATEVTVETRKEISLSRSVMSGGLVHRKTVEEKHTSRTETREGFLVIHRGDGERDVVLTESRLDFRFLGAEMQIVGFANIERTTRWLHTRLPGVAIEDRVARPGLVSAVASWPGDATDLAIELVRRCFVAGAL